MQVKDLIVNGDARIIGNLYTKDGLVGGGAGGSSGDGGGGLTYSLSKSGSTIILTGSDGSTSSVQDNDTTVSYSLPLAASGVRGGVQIGYSQNGKNYPVQLSSEKMYVNVPWSDTTYSNATQSAAGLMSSADKAKLDGIAAGANNYTYTLPAATSSTLGGVKIGSNITVNSGTISLTKANVTNALGYTPPTTDTNTTYSAGTGLTLSGTTFSVNANAAPAALGYAPSYITLVKGESETGYSTSYNSFPTFNTSKSAYALSQKGNLTVDQEEVYLGDRSDQLVWGVRVGDNIHDVRVTTNIRYHNQDSSTCNLHTYLILNRNGWEWIPRGVCSGLIGSNGYQTHSIDMIIPVQTGDFLYVYSYKATAGRNIDITSTTNNGGFSTYMTVEAVG